jgi:aldehyde:ferredoxin oxidoreductase
MTGCLKVFEPTIRALSNTTVDPDRLNAIHVYYETMGWDETGIPRRTTLEQLDIGWIA